MYAATGSATPQFPTVPATRPGPTHPTAPTYWRGLATAPLGLARAPFAGAVVWVSLTCSRSCARRQVQKPFTENYGFREVPLKQRRPVTNDGDQQPYSQHAFHRRAEKHQRHLR